MAALAAQFAVPGPNYSDGVMVCVKPTLEQAENLALAGGLPVDEIHCTLAYFGKVTDPVYQELGDTIRAELLEAICDAACESGVLQAEVAGVTVFSGNDTRPLVCLVDAPGLFELRAEFLEELEGTASDVMAVNHGYTPHVTLAYEASPDGKDLAAAESRVGAALTFESIELVFGTERYVVPLTGMQGMEGMAPMMALAPGPVAGPDGNWRAERLAVAADVALDEVWKVAGARLRAQIAQPSLAAVAERIKRQPNENVVPILREWAISTGFDLSTLVSFNGLTERVETWEPAAAARFMAGLTGIVVTALESGDRASITPTVLLDFATTILSPSTEPTTEG
jgi:2'-5' RNA ligase